MKSTDIKRLLEQQADPDKAEKMKAYMKDQFEFLGISSPDRKSLSLDYLKSTKSLSKKELLQEVKNLWDDPYRECQYIAIEALRKNLKSLDSSDLKTVEWLIATKSWWDTVDALAVHIVGHLFKNDKLKEEYLSRWLTSKDMWLKRSCILFQLNYKTKTDFELLRTIILSLKDDKRFFIQKAIGWSLRQYSRTDPRAVEVTVEDFALTGVAKKEALRLL